ncbi:MAG: helicase-related protein [Nostoc sp.]
MVFSQFVDHLHIIRDYLEQQGINYQYLDGSTSVAERKKRVDAFQAGS